MAKAKKSKGKSKKTKARRTKAKTSKSKKPVRRAAAASHGAKKKSKAKRAAPKKASKKAKPARRPTKAARPAKAAKTSAPKKKKQIVGEGDYQASRAFLKDQGNFVKRHNAEIPQMGRDAEAALDGPEGAKLRMAEEEARNHSRAGGSES